MLYKECFYELGMTPIKAEGYVFNGKTEINMSSIYTKLIQEAGRFCDAYASDLLYDIDAIEKLLDEGESETVWIAFRDMGVDSWSYIECRTPHEAMEYRAIYKVDIEFTEDDYYDAKVTATLYKVAYSKSDHEYKLLMKGGK